MKLRCRVVVVVVVGRDKMVQVALDIATSPVAVADVRREEALRDAVDQSGQGRGLRGRLYQGAHPEEHVGPQDHAVRLIEKETRQYRLGR